MGCTIIVLKSADGISAGIKKNKNYIIDTKIIPPTI